jgi:hypothetical protein
LENILRFEVTSDLQRQESSISGQAAPHASPLGSGSLEPNDAHSLVLIRLMSLNPGCPRHMYAGNQETDWREEGIL